MTKENKEILIKRLKSFCWRVGAMIAVIVLNFVGENLGLTSLSPEVQTVLGLVLGEITKHISNVYGKKTDMSNV